MAALALDSEEILADVLGMNRRDLCTPQTGVERERANQLSTVVCALESGGHRFVGCRPWHRSRNAYRREVAGWGQDQRTCVLCPSVERAHRAASATLSLRRPVGAREPPRKVVRCDTPRVRVS